jgi:Tol biopolymer transport system component
VHRDLKPANVKITPDGVVKILDFGLAKASDGDAGTGAAALSESPTISRHMTEMGVILGTAAYMSPEQARGRAVDKRADVWAFGVVLYEMLAGRRPFGGETVSEILASVIKDPPDLAALGSSVPPSLVRLIGRCLEKDPRARLRDIGDARLALEEPEVADARPSPASASRRAAPVLPWLVAAVLAAATLVLLLRPRPQDAGAPLRRFTFDLPWRSVPNWTDFDVALSPTGTHVAWYGRRDNDVRVWVRHLDRLEPVPLADAREADDMAFSPDGEWIALVDSHGIRKFSIRGGRAQSLTPRVDAEGLSWGPDGKIVIGGASGLMRLSASGGSVSPLTRVDTAAGETAHVQPSHLPDGRHALFTIQRASDPQVAVVDLDHASIMRLPLKGSDPVWSPSGHVLFRQGSSVYAAPFDPRTLTLTGDAVPVLEQVRRGPHVAADGTMVYIPERGESSARVVWVDRNGRATAVPGQRLDYSHLTLQGRTQALLNIGYEVYVSDLERGTRRLLCDQHALFPIWSADGEWATFSAKIDGRRGIYRQRADGTGGPELLLEGSGLVPTSWNARTGELAFFDDASDISILSPAGRARKFLSGSFNERSGRFSPDGRWFAFVSDETGEFQVYAVPYPGPGPKVAVSADGGMSPVWSQDGRELFFMRGGKLFSAAMTFSPALAAARPVELFDGPYTLDLQGHQRYDVAPDGRFLMVENSDDFRIVLVQGFASEVARVAPSKRAR